MKALKVLLLAPLAAAMLAGVVAAREYKQIVPQQTQPMTQEQMIMRHQQQMRQLGVQPGMPTAGEGVFFIGTLSGVDIANREILVNSDVMGLMGPQKRDIPFAIGRDSTLTICFRSLNTCEGYAFGDQGFQALANLEGSLGKVKKNVIIVGEADSNRVVHTQIDYLM